MTFLPFTLDAGRPPLEAFATLGYVVVGLAMAAFIVAIAATLFLTVGQPDGRFSGFRQRAAGTLFIAGAVGVVGILLAVALLV